jgi:adenylyltransferase/sulfurtransferase
MPAERSASIFRFEGQASVFGANDGPGYRCLDPEPPPAGLVPSCAEGGVLGVLPGLLGIIQATEVLKLVLGAGNPLVGRLLLVDALAMSFREVRLRRNPECAVCGPNPTVTKLIDYEGFCGVSRGEERAGLLPEVPSISVEELKRRIDARESIVIVDVREPHETRICAFPGSVNIPLGVLSENLSLLPSAGEIVVHCKTGARSARAVQFLMASGSRNAELRRGDVVVVGHDPACQHQVVVEE